MKKCLLVVLALLLAQCLAAQTPRTDHRPRIGVVLGGGGAKGAAHIGVLKYLEEQGIPVDYITGTSMGSIIGGLYALGYTPEQMAELIGSLDWSRYMSREIDPTLLSSRERQMRSNYLLRIPFNLQDADNALSSEGGISKAFIKSLPGSFVGGSNVTNLFNSLSVGYQDSMSYDRLPIPFACVATDILTGQAYVMHSGRLPISMRASMAIPGFFDPVRIDGHLLLDGGMVNNFPTDVCREMGADIIIGIEVAQGLDTNISHLQSLPQIASQLMQIAVANGKSEHRQLCDIYIRPDMTGFNMLSFNKEAIDTLVSRGYQQALSCAEQIDSLRRLLDSYGPHPKVLHAPPAEYVINDSVFVSSVEIEYPQHAHINERGREDVRRQMMKEGISVGWMSGGDIERSIQRLLGTGAFNSINYRLSPSTCPSDTFSSSCYRLILSPENAEPHVFAAGLRYDTEESAAVLFALGLNQYHTSGAKLLFNARLNYNPQFRALASFEAWNLGTLNIDYTFRECSYLIRDHQDIVGYTLRNDHRIRLYFSEFQSRKTSWLIGAQEEIVSYDRTSSGPGLSTAAFDKSYYGFFGHITYDTRDKKTLANNGLLFNVAFNWRILHGNNFKPMGVGLGDIMLYLRKNHTYGTSRLSGTPQVYARLTSRHGHDYEFHTLYGGTLANRYGQNHLPFVGISNVQITFKDALIARYDLNYNIRGPHYISLIANVIGGSTQHIFDIEDTKPVGIYGGFSLRYGMRSVLGLIAADLYWSNLTNRWGVSVSVGYDI
ncbi:MAG: patatin-like phospholipase family protein [Bacteroidales bacterium]|nr:patatin-like phospholipase family protein [Bacteroidales bacterium]